MLLAPWSLAISIAAIPTLLLAAVMMRRVASVYAPVFPVRYFETDVDVDGERQLHSLLREYRASKILRRPASERSHRLDQDLQDRGCELTRLLVGNFNGRSNGEPRAILGSALPQDRKAADTPKVVIRRILLIWRRLSLYLSLHMPFSQ